MGVFRRPGDAFDAQRRPALQRRAEGGDEAETVEKLEAAKRFRARFL